MTETTSRPLSALGALRERLTSSREWTDDDRATLTADLFPEGPDAADFVWRFVTLMVLSTVIAALGLLLNSAAVVIGAMLVAPLMTPILGVAISMVLGDHRRLVKSVGLIAFGVLTAVLAAITVSAVSPGTVSGDQLTGELLARTSPSLLDLGVAIAAGLAAGYVLAHPQASSSLPGVAIAVALVPPLATVGISFQLGARAEAQGALLLFATNLFAIILAAMLVALSSGVAPLRMREGRGGRIRLGLLITALMMVAVAVPLTIHTIDIVEDRNFTREALASIRVWDPNSDLVELEADVSDGRGTISLVVATRNEPIPAWRLAEILQRHTGRPVAVDVQYIVETVDSAVAN